MQLQNVVPYYLITQPTISLQQSSSWRPPRILRNQNVQHSVHKGPPVFPALNHINPNQTTSPSFFKTNFTDLLRSRHRFSLPNASSLFLLRWYHSVRITNCEVRNYSDLSKLLLLPLWGEKMFAPPPCSRIPSVLLLTFNWEARTEVYTINMLFMDNAEKCRKVHTSITICSARCFWTLENSSASPWNAPISHKLCTYDRYFTLRTRSN
jgi:hypothetical protein